MPINKLDNIQLRLVCYNFDLDMKNLFFIFLLVIYFIFSIYSYANDKYLELNYGIVEQKYFNTYKDDKDKSFVDGIKDKSFDAEYLSIGINVFEFPFIDKLTFIRQYIIMNFNGNVDINAILNILTDDKYIKNIEIEKYILVYTWIINFEYLNIEYGLGNLIVSYTYELED